MDTIKVLVTHEVDEDALAVMRDADPRVQVTMVPYREKTEQRGLRRKGKMSEHVQAPLSPDLLAGLSEADVTFSLDLPTNVLKLAPRLRWVQNIGAGIDHLLAPGGVGVWESDVMITNMGGFNSRAIAEFVIGYMLSYVKRTREFFEAQAEKRWSRQSGQALGGQTAGIVGMGRIGAEVAKLSKAFDMTVIANRRYPPDDVPPYVDRMLGPEGLHDLLGASDFVVVALPAVADTAKIIGEAELRAMKPTGVIINVARGTVIDEQALTRALYEGWIGGAALDVFEQEPLSSESALWEAPRTIITPHASAISGNYGTDSARFFAANLKRFIAGEPLQNLVDKRKGY